MGTGIDTGSVAGARQFCLADSHGEAGGRWVAGRQAAVCVTGSLGSCLHSPVVLEARWSRWAPRNRTPKLVLKLSCLSLSAALGAGRAQVALHRRSLADKGVLYSGHKGPILLAKGNRNEDREQGTVCEQKHL